MAKTADACNAKGALVAVLKHRVASGPDVVAKASC